MSLIKNPEHWKYVMLSNICKNAVLKYYKYSCGKLIQTCNQAAHLQ